MAQLKPEAAHSLETRFRGKGFADPGSGVRLGLLGSWIQEYWLLRGSDIGLCGCGFRECG